MKRKRKSQRDGRAEKRQKIETRSGGNSTLSLLRFYYTKVLTLRQFLIWSLSKSKKRQRKLLHYGSDNKGNTAGDCDAQVVKILDCVVIGISHQAELPDLESIDKDITLFTQQCSTATATISPTQGALKQSDIVNFVIWSILRRHHGNHRPSHLLSHGFQTGASGPNNGNDLTIVPEIPGVFSSCINPHVQALKAHPWTALPSLLGKGAERIFSDMLLSCGVFVPVKDSSNLSQLSGVPLSDLKPLKVNSVATLQSGTDTLPRGAQRSLKATATKERGLADIRFVRYRILYAKPVLNATGKIRFGLDHVHVLNRHNELEDQQQTIRIMQYIFPRQFGLHNVFTSQVDWNDTSHPFKEYTFREEEIERSDHHWRQAKLVTNPSEIPTQRPLPKRLRGRILQLVSRLRKRHSRCSYSSMLEHYCPNKRTSSPENVLDRATSPTQVSAFCRAVILKVFPRELWGPAGDRGHNTRKLLTKVDEFIRMRRFETMGVHDLLQDLIIKGLPWLIPENVQAASRLSATDFKKRRELMAELLYYLFDSFLIPLIRSHFYVTESGAQRNQLFYFRHDVWKEICDPALKSLKDTMLQPRNTDEVNKQLAKREFDASRVRMLPKDRGMRPIINLRRRIQKARNGRLILGRSVNKILSPAFSALNYEKAAHPDMLASALFSPEDMYPRIQAFRAKLDSQGLTGKPLYFAKVDVKRAFDTIPQKRLMQLVRTILEADTYHVAEYSRAKLIDGNNDEVPGFGAKPSWKYRLTKAGTGDKGFDFAGEVETDTAEGRTRTIYVDGVMQKPENRTAILKLLEDHIESHLIKIGNRFYRQREGIPQGSKVSSLLCSYFYAELEREALGFVQDGHSILLRLIDDFLVISTKRDIAERFVRVMHRGLPEFGVEVKAEKSQANFDVEVDGYTIARLPRETDFPYCGNAINTVTLNLGKDKERRKQSNMPDSISVEYSKIPGQSFYRKVLDALKQQMKASFLSTNHNSITTVLSNLHHGFTEVAQKTYHYMHALPTNKQPGAKLVIRAVEAVIELGCVLMKNRRRSGKDVAPYACSVTQAQARWLACTAFVAVFRRRQTKHRVLLRWLERQLALPALGAQRKSLEGIIG